MTKYFVKYTMKKLLFAFLFTSFGLTACSAGVNNLKPVRADHKIQHICLKGTERKAPEDFIEAMQQSLQKKNIRSERLKNSSQQCDYVLYFSVKGNAKIIGSAKLEVRDMKNRQSIGSLTYKRRGEEKTRADNVGLQGQTDFMINQLFE